MIRNNYNLVVNCTICKRKTVRKLYGFWDDEQNIQEVRQQTHHCRYCIINPYIWNIKINSLKSWRDF